MIKDPVVTDEVRQKKVGTNLGTVVEEVEKGWIRQFCQAIGDANPIYTDEAYAKETVHGGIIAPPTFFSPLSQLNEVKFATSLMSRSLRGLTR